MEKKLHKIQLRYLSGKVINYITSAPPTSSFVLPGDPPYHFKVMMVVIKGGKIFEILQTIYKEQKIELAKKE